MRNKNWRNSVRHALSSKKGVFTRHCNQNSLIDINNNIIFNNNNIITSNQRGFFWSYNPLYVLNNKNNITFNSTSKSTLPIKSSNNNNRLKKTKNTNNSQQQINREIKQIARNTFIIKLARQLWLHNNVIIR